MLGWGWLLSEAPHWRLLTLCRSVALGVWDWLLPLWCTSRVLRAWHSWTSGVLLSSSLSGGNSTSTLLSGSTSGGLHLDANLTDGERCLRL